MRAPDSLLETKDDEYLDTDALSASEEGRLHTQGQSYDFIQPIPPILATRMSGPSPYQHPAQYPAPVAAQIPPDIPTQEPYTFNTLSDAHHPITRSEPRQVQPQHFRASVPAASIAHTATPRPTTASRPQQTHNQQPSIGHPTVDRALDSIQTSLAALHERLSLMEQTQAALQAATDDHSFAYFSRSPILQLLRAAFVRAFVFLRLRPPSWIGGGSRRSSRSLSSLLGRALLTLLAGVRDLSRDAIAIMFLAAAVASLRSARGDWRAVIRAWARILALASGVGLAREGGWMIGLSGTGEGL